MTDLDNTTGKIKAFLNASILKFQSENNTPSSIGVYCCPWSGWISMHFNATKKLDETKNNCLDFEFVEFDFMEIPEWKNEYTTDNPEFKLNGSIHTHDPDFGDEAFNQLIFDYLKPIVTELKESYHSEILLQMLDSNFVEKI